MYLASVMTLDFVAIITSPQSSPGDSTPDNFAALWQFSHKPENWKEKVHPFLSFLSNLLSYRLQVDIESLPRSYLTSLIKHVLP